MSRRGAHKFDTSQNEKVRHFKHLRVGTSNAFGNLQTNLQGDKRHSAQPNEVNMSFQNKQPVNWMRLQQLDSGFTCGVSEKSGIMKITFPNSFHTVMLYKDQVNALGLTHPDVLAYVERNSDIIRNSGENQAAKKIDKAKQKLVDGIINNVALNDEQKQAMLKLIAA